MKVDVKTLEGADMSVETTTERVGSGLRIAPGFLAIETNDASRTQTTVEGRYDRAQGRYVVAAITVRGLGASDEVNGDTLRKITVQKIVQEAAAHCIAITLSDEPNAEWLSVAHLSSTTGRVIPASLAEEVVKRGSNEARMDVIEILYGMSALAGSPPVKTIVRELGIPHRTASVWVGKARDAGRLEGMNFIVGRQADG